MHFKTKIYEHLYQTISKRMVELQSAILSAKESRDADTKSSAGDKHETSRALAQIEIDKLEIQLEKTYILEKELKTINLNKNYDQVESGSLIFTSRENYFISIGMGKIEVENQIYYAISLGSPIGEILKLKKVGDKVLFQGREIIINEIV